MPSKRKTLERLGRPPSLVAQVEKLLREAIAEGRFGEERLPTEVDLAEQLGVSRETVRRAAENLEREGLLIKYRRRGTFTRPPVKLPAQLPASTSTLIGYLQAEYHAPRGQIENATPGIGQWMLQGALEEAARAGLDLIVRRVDHVQLSKVFQILSEQVRLRGLIFVSCGEEKLLRRISGLALPTVLLDHDLHLPQINTLRDDSLEGARQAVHYLVQLGHRRIAFANWHRSDLNPWRLRGYRLGLLETQVPRRRAWEIEGELTDAGARHIVDRLLSLRPLPTALLCFNNTLAGQVIGHLTHRGYRVPDDFSVMGGGGEEVPGLTCHQVDWFGMGREALSMLQRAFDQPGNRPSEHQLAPHVLRTGSTTAAPCRP